MTEGPGVPERLDSWKQIAAHVGRDVRTVIRWEQQRGLPVHRVPGGGRQAVFAYRHEIDAWLLGKTPLLPEPDPQPEVPALPAEAPASLPVEAVRRVERASVFSQRNTLLAFLLVVIASAGLLAFRLNSRPTIVFTGETQITEDGLPRIDLVTDGSKIYFDQWSGGRGILSSVPVEGGEIKEISTPFVDTQPIAASKDGSRLLVLASEGMEHERALWIVPVQGGGAPQRVGDVRCQAAAWSPDERQIAYANGDTLYLTKDSGETPRAVASLDGVAMQLHWSIDGKRLFFLLRDMKSLEYSLWELVLADTDHPHSSQLIPLHYSSERDINTSAVFKDDDSQFMSGYGAHSDIISLQKTRWPWHQELEASIFMSELNHIEAIAVDPKNSLLYAMKAAAEHSELIWYDKTAGEFHPFLPGISATEADFSRDGHWITYVRQPQTSLWVTSSDGKQNYEINTAGIIELELPRWSPDGKQIAFMGRHPGLPWRIYVVSKDGSGLREASHGSDHQGAPTWSPDGQRLIYGRVECQEERACAVGEIDLKSGEETVVVGSEGLSTARWSPDGRYIAALRADQFQVYLLDVKMGLWRKLADDVNGNDLAWSTDSKTLYASKPGGVHPEVVRIPLNGGSPEPVLDLTSFSELPGRIDSWFSITPDNSIVFRHMLNGDDIYALHYSEK